MKNDHLDQLPNSSVQQSIEQQKRVYHESYAELKALKSVISDLQAQLERDASSRARDAVQRSKAVAFGQKSSTAGHEQKPKVAWG